MFFETIILPFILGLVTNKTSDKLFKESDLNEIVQELYNEAEDEFNKKFNNAFGGKYRNFIARQENFDFLLQKALSYKDISEIQQLNVQSYDGSITPDEVVNDFLVVFKQKLDSDERLIQYRGKREHYILTEEILGEIKKIKNVRINKFENIDSYIKSNTKLQPYSIRKTENEISKIIEGLNHYDIILIDSFRGFGKTETLLRVALEEKVKKQFDNILIMKHGVRNIIDAMQMELFDNVKYLIVIDDVDLCKEEFVELINFIRASKETNKILIATQSYMVGEIGANITKVGMIRNFNNISINDWKKDDFVELLRKTSGFDEVEDEDIIAMKYPSPSLITWIGKNKASSNDSNIEKLFIEYKAVLESDCYEILKNDFSREECKKLIFNLCCSVPFHLDEKFLGLLENRMQINSFKLKSKLNSLVNGGILRKVGYKYRFFPDLKGDIYLAYTLQDDLYPEELNFWINNSQGKVFQNINEARLICNIDIDEKLKPIMAEWSNVKNYYEQSEILKRANYIISFAPESVLNLIYYYFEYAKGIKKGDYFRLTSDNFGPLILKLWHYNTNKEAILEFVRELEKYDFDGVYDNYKVKGIIKVFFSPVNSSISLINSSLGIIEKWLREGGTNSLILFKYAACEVLKGSHEVTKSIINGIEFGQSVVNSTDEVIAVRKKCINIMEFLLNEKFEYETVQIIEEICNYIGNANWSYISEDKLPLHEEIVAEREQLVDLLGSKLSSSDNIMCNIVLEKILIKWWAMQYSGTSRTEDYLNKFHRSDEYLFVKYYVDADYRIISFDEILNIAPDEDRWSWFVHNVMYNADDSTDDYFKIASMLHKKITSVQDFFDFLKKTGSIVKKIGVCWSSSNILYEWCKLDSNLFKQCLFSVHYYETFEVFRANILSSIVLLNDGCDSKIIDSMLENLDKLSNEEIYTLLHLASYKSLSDEFAISVVQRIIDGSNLGYSGSIIHKIYFIFKDRDIKLVTELLISIIDKYSFDKSMIDSLDFILKHFIGELTKSESFSDLKETIIRKLSEANDFGYNENSILESVFINIDEAFDFLVRRISSKLADQYSLIPNNGFTYLKKFIVDVEGYGRLVKLVFYLNENGVMKSYDNSNIYKPLQFLKDDKGEFIVTQLLNIYIKEEKTNGVLEIINNYRVDTITLKSFVNGLIYLKENLMQNEAEKLIYSHRYLCEEWSWSRSIGGDSPEISNRIELYKEMYNLLPFGNLRLIAMRCIEVLEDDIKRDLIMDEEFLNPR